MRQILKVFFNQDSQGVLAEIEIESGTMESTEDASCQSEPTNGTFSLGPLKSPLEGVHAQWYENRCH